MARFTLRQSTVVVDKENASPAYRVTHAIDLAMNASTAVFVHKTTSQVFDHVAASSDMERWPDSYEEASLAGKAFYRTAAATRTWPTLTAVGVDLLDVARRVRLLARELSAVRTATLEERITVIEEI